MTKTKNKHYRIIFLFKNNSFESFEGNINDDYGKYKFKSENFIGKINLINFNDNITIIKDGKGILYDKENKFTGEWKNNLKIK